MTNSTNKKLRQRDAYAVWEITLKCNLSCHHCGSRAGNARNNELSTEEAFDLIHQLSEAGITEVTLIGGEAYLRKDWLQLVEEIVRVGMVCTLTTGGYGISAQNAKRMKKAGLRSVSVSIDGMKKAHNKQRGKIDSWQQAFKTLEHLNKAGIPTSANTQVNRLTAPDFPLLYEQLIKIGATAWQIGMTVPMGNAADNPEMLLQPSELLVFHPLLAYLAKRGRNEKMLIQPGNSFGYYGPYEQLLRSFGSNDSEWAFWRGCNAGLSTLGIESDGTIKGCPSLPTTPYAGGNIREHSLVDIVTQSEALTFNLKAGTDEGTQHLWGFCKQCEYAQLCRGGCSWTAHVFFNRKGNNPYCHHRSLVNAANGKREYFKIIRPANGKPFDNGEFCINSLDINTEWIESNQRFTANQIHWPKQWLEDDTTLSNYIEKSIKNNINTMKKHLQS